MADTINIPGMGAQKKTTVYVAGAIGVVIIGVVWYRSRAQSTDTSTAVDSAIDPATGYPYGSAEDNAALQAQAAYQSSGNLGGSSDAYTGGQQPQGFASNDAWKVAADDYLINTVGLDGPAVSQALGKYLTGDDVVAGGAEDNYIRQAIASKGYPPVSGAQGYPPSIRHSATPPPTQNARKYVVQAHKISANTAGRGLVQRFSDPSVTVSTPAAIEEALRRTVNDNRNSRYRGFYSSHGGVFPAKAALYVTTVQKG